MDGRTLGIPSPNTISLYKRRKRLRNIVYMIIEETYKWIKNEYSDRQNSESLMNRMRLYFVQSIFFFRISSVVKQYRALLSSITCKGVVLWFSKWYQFLLTVSQPIRINYCTWKIMYGMFTSSILLI